MRNQMLAAAAAIAVLSIAAEAMPHGRPGLWTITTSMKMANMPQIPPEALAMMKQRGIKIPGMGGEPIITQICMTPQDVAEGAAVAQRMHSEHGIDCKPRVLNETGSSVTTEIACHGEMMDGVGHSTMSWRGDSHYEGDYSFKGVMHGQANEMHSHFAGDFVKGDCGSVKPFHAEDMPHGTH
jgi:Protein of unknown function (DUF3617)